MKQMGRYYSGDIEGKFWFGVQSSNDADFFGVVGDSSDLEYCFTTDNLPQIEAGLADCVSELGEFKDKLDAYFLDNNGYNDKILSEALSITEDKLAALLVWYARLELGQKIFKCVKQKGECYFAAEL